MNESKSNGLEDIISQAIIEYGVLLDTIVYFSRLRYSLSHFVFVSKSLTDLTVTR